MGHDIALDLGLVEASLWYHQHQYVEPTETIEHPTALYRYFLNPPAELRKIDTILEFLDYAVAGFVYIDIPVNSAGLVHRENAINFGACNWDE